MHSIYLIVGMMCGEMLTVIILSSFFLLQWQSNIVTSLYLRCPVSCLYKRKAGGTTRSSRHAWGIKQTNQRLIMQQVRSRFRQLDEMWIGISGSCSQHPACLHTYCARCRFLSAPRSERTRGKSSWKRDKILRGAIYLFSYPLERV